MTAPGEPDNPFERFVRLYDWEHDPFDADLELYVAFARRFGGPVLELACGSGRVLAPLLAAGFDCTGVDSAPSMLRRARQRLAPWADRLTLAEQSVEALHLDRLYRTILFPLDGLALLTSTEAQQSALRAARRCAAHDARLVLDLSNGNLRGGAEPPDEVIHHLTALDPASGQSITKWVVRRSDPSEQLDDLLFLYDEVDAATGFLRRTTVPLRLRWLARFELQLLLASSGWEVAELYGDYDLSPYGPGSDRLIAVATPR